MLLKLGTHYGCMQPGIILKLLKYCTQDAYDDRMHPACRLHTGVCRLHMGVCILHTPVFRLQAGCMQAAY